MNLFYLSQIALLFLLFIPIFIMIRQLLNRMIWLMTKRTLLNPGHVHTGVDKLRIHGDSFKRIRRHMQDIMESQGVSWNIRALWLLSLAGLLSGLMIGGLVFHDVKGVLLLALMLCSLPYLWLRMRLVGIQMKSRMDFLPAVEIFYQYYSMSDTRNIRHVVARCLEQNRMRISVRNRFELLFRHLSTNRSLEDAIRIFSLGMGHLWGNYFANMLRIGLTEGVDLTQSLQTLIRDMRAAQVADQLARSRLLEIRIANFSPPILFVVFIYMNFELNGQQAAHYYLYDPAGKSMLLDALALMFGSFIMGLYLSIRRI